MSNTIYKNAIKCVVFDLDGTLLNTLNTINHYLNFALVKNGLPTVDRDCTRAFVGDGAVKLIHRALAHIGKDTPENFERVFVDYNQSYDSDPYYLTEIYEGIQEMLSELKERKISLAVLSNKPDFATVSCINRFFPDIFSVAHGSRQGVPLKPDPASLIATLSEIGFSVSEAAYVGDSEPDVAICRNAGISLPIAVSWGFRSISELMSAGAELVIDHPSKISSLV